MSPRCGSGSRRSSRTSLPDMLHLKRNTSSRSGPSPYTCSLGSQVHVLCVTDGTSFGKVTRKNTSSRVKRSEEHTSELQSRLHLVCRLLLEKKKKKKRIYLYYNIIRACK